VQRPTLIGVIHLPPLPGSPLAALPIQDIVRRAAEESAILADSGFHAIILENFGDLPFFPHRVPSISVAAMTACACEVRRVVSVPLGINVLRNDASSALAIAIASRADFIRVNVHCAARLTDQGIVEGLAHDTLRERKALGAERIALYCDVDVKHAAAIAPRDIGDEAEELAERALADAVLVTGAGTGRSVALGQVKAVKARVHVPVLAASGTTEETLPEVLAACDGVIVGSALRKDGRAGAELEPARVRAFAEAFGRAASRGDGHAR